MDMDEYSVGDIIRGFDCDNEPHIGKVLEVKKYDSSHPRDFAYQLDAEKNGWKVLVFAHRPIELIKRRPGRPKGIARDGSYGRGVSTKVVRVPEHQVELVHRLLIDLPELVDLWKSQAKSTRDWTQANRLLHELEVLLEG